MKPVFEYTYLIMESAIEIQTKLLPDFVQI